MHEREYCLYVLLGDFLGLPYRQQFAGDASVRITLAGDPLVRSLTTADLLFQTPSADWLQPISLPRRPLKVWDLRECGISAKVVSPQLPVIYGRDPLEPGFVHIAEDEIRLGLDIFGSAFFMLSRYEEIVKRERDEVERFPAVHSLAHQEGFLDRPLVNEYLEVLRWALGSLWPQLQFRKRAFRVVPTHDVDRPLSENAFAPLSQIARLASGDIVKRRAPLMAIRRVRSWARIRSGDREADWYNTFGWLMDVSEKQGVVSKFYFMAARTSEQDVSYSITEPWIQNLMKAMYSRGHEIGLHTSFNSFRDREQIRHEQDLLLHTCEAEGICQCTWGGRQHYLRWEAPATWQYWDDAALDYDSTVAYADRTGFRCGVCYSYSVFNAATRRRLRLREQPLIVMDMSLYHPDYMNLPPELAAQEALKLKERCRLFDGDFVVLWHNNALLQRWQVELYQGLIG